MLRCLFRNRTSRKVIESQFIRWWDHCIVCSCMTANEVSYLLLLRRDVDQFTVPMCSRCRKSLSYRQFKIINRVIFSDHRIILIARP